MRLIVYYLLAILFLIPAYGISSENDLIVILQDRNFSATQNTIKILEGDGVQIRHVLPPRILLGKAETNILGKIENELNVQYVLTDFHGASSLAGVNDFEARFLSACEIFQNGGVAAQPDSTRGTPHPLAGDFQTYKDERTGANTTINAFEATSSYMIGRVVVDILFMESYGGQENWTTDQKTNSIAEIIQGLDRWCDYAFDNNAPLTWYYNIYYTVPTIYEPITMHWVPYWDPWNLAWAFFWINDAMDYLGYQHGWDGMHQFIHDTRGSFQCDWGFMLYMVMDQNDPDHMFQPPEDNTFAYSHLEGPYAVMTYNNDNWGIFNMDMVCQHEIGHVFGANDEYAAGCDNDDCADGYGFLNVNNGNCESCNSNPAPCIMRGNGDIVACYYTKGQIGWFDYDGDQWNEAPDRNTRWSQNIWDVNPGDMIDINNNLGQLVRKIPVTPDNHFVAQNGRGGYVWDCTNFLGERVSYAAYFIQVNGQNRPQVYPDVDEIAPIISNIYCSNNILHFILQDTDTGGDVVRVRILSQGQEVSRPIFDKTLTSATGTEQTVDLSYLPAGPYTAEIRAWDAGGNAAIPVSGNFDIMLFIPSNFQVMNYCDYNNQIQNIRTSWNTLSQNASVAIERKTTITNWQEIGRVLGQNYFSDGTALGSEFYYYRARAVSGNYYSPYTNEISIRAFPRVPSNFSATVMHNSNRVRISWSPPILQLPGTITGYFIRRMEGGGNAIYFGPYLNGPIYICAENKNSANYTFGVKSQDSYNNSSMYTRADIYTGTINDCVPTPTYPDEWKTSSDSILGNERQFLFINHPNPFNSSTEFEYDLPEASQVFIEIFDILGHKIETIVDEYQSSGFHRIVWNADDRAAGLYFCRFRAGESSETRKMLLLK